MIFKRQQHDGLWAVIHRTGFKAIVFENGKYETTDPEECKTLMEMGYDYEEILEEYPVTIMGDTGIMAEVDKLGQEVIESNKNKHGKKGR